MIRVLLIDDQELSILGLRAFCASNQSFRIVQELKCPLCDLTPGLLQSADVILFEYFQNGRYQLEGIQQLACYSPKLPLLVFSSHMSGEFVVKAVRSGATGVLTKHCRLDELTRTVEIVARGEVFLHHSIAHHFVADLRGHGGNNQQTLLSPRQKEILRLIANGGTTKSMAAELGISRKTVESHRSQIMAALNLHDLAGLIRYALERQRQDEENAGE